MRESKRSVRVICSLSATHVRLSVSNRFDFGSPLAPPSSCCVFVINNDVVKVVVTRVFVWCTSAEKIINIRQLFAFTIKIENHSHCSMLRVND